MLIVSKFRDYYDTAIVYGVDKSIVYKREQKVLEYDYKKLQGTSWYESKKQFLQPDLSIDTKWTKLKVFERVECSVIGFCGKLYPVYVFTYKDGNVEYSYDKESATEILKSANLYKKTKSREIFWSRRFHTSSYIDEFFDSSNWNYLLRMFQDLKEPIFLLKQIKATGRGYEMKIAPTLSDYKFAKVFAPTQAFQEIQNYISGVLGVGERDTVTLSDEMKSHKKGYDKWSFRTHKEDSKKPRKKK